MKPVIQHREELDLQVDVGRPTGEPGQVCLVEAVAQTVERAGQAAVDERPDCQRDQGLRQVAVDLTLPTMIEGTDESGIRAYADQIADTLKQALAG